MSQQSKQLANARSCIHALMKVPRPADTGENASLIPFATATADVSAFCRAVFSKVIPRAFWGDGLEGSRNQAVVMRNVDLFIHLGRHERLSLHTVSQGLKVLNVISAELMLTETAWSNFLVDTPEGQTHF